MQLIKITLLIVSFLISYLFFPSQNKISTNDEINIDSISSLRIAVVGDLMCHSPQFNYARVTKDSFDFNPVYRFIKPYLEDADFTFGNLETVIGIKPDSYSGYPRFKSPPEYISALGKSGFDFLCFANNHTLDQGEKGVLNTIQCLNNNHIGYTGAFTSYSDRDSIRIFEMNGIRFSVLAYSFGTNGSLIPKGKDYLINLIDYDLIARDIALSRQKGAEIVLVNFHFGNEYQRYPSDYQKLVVQKTIEFGADLITASHPHVIQPVKFFKTKNAKLDSVFVTYSLGNFISNQRKRFTDSGVIIFINLVKNKVTNELKISSVEYLPTWVYKGKTENGNEFIILPLKENHNYEELNFLSESDKQKMIQAFEDTKEIIHSFGSEIILYKNELSD